jgi:arylsulfatase A-like enzyme
MKDHITRRGMLAAGAMGGLALGQAGRAAATRDRPNILWLVSEDNNPFIGAYGDRVAHTPTIDALARTGLLFRNVYSNAPVCAPSRFAILTGAYPQSCAPANHMRAVAKVQGVLQTYPELMRAAGYFCTNNAKTDYNCDVDPTRVWDRQGAQAHWRDRPAGAPFMAVFNHEITHESQLFHPTPGRVKGNEVRVPRYLPDTPAIRDDYASYYNLIEKMDGQLAARLAELAADGLADDTIVFYYSDNGGVLPRSKRYCYDEGLRVAMVVHVPPKWRHLAPAGPGSVIDVPVSFIDLAPTILSIAGAPQPAHMAGRPFLGARIAAPQRYAFGMRNRMDERIDFVRTVTDGRWRYIRNYMPHRPWGMHGAFEWLLKSYQEWETLHRAGKLDAVQDRFFGTKPFEELYDLSRDPDQIDNLAPRRPADLARLSHALDAHMIAINDNGFIPEGMAGEGWIPSRDRVRYPLERLMALGRQAAAARPGDRAALMRALADPNPVVRYWAATGLLIQGAPADAARAGLTTAMTQDPEPQVRVVAAEAVARWGDDTAIAVLGSLAARDQSREVRLAALNALTVLGERARSQLPVIDLAAQEEDAEYLRNAGRYLSAVLRNTYRPDYPVFQIERLGRPAPRKT